MFRGLVQRFVPLHLLAGSVLAISACDGGGSSAPPTIEVSSEQLKPGGVYITYVNGCEKGCDQLERGDLVLELNGQKVSTAKDLRSSQVATGQPVSSRSTRRAARTSRSS